MGASRGVSVLFRRLFLPALLLVACSNAACASDSEQLTIYCDGGRTFLADISAESAFVTIGTRTVALQRRDSSLGRRFDATGAALIVDGEMVALVLDDDINFQNCRSNGADYQVRNTR